MFRRFVFDPNENTKTVKDYYEAYNEQDKHYNTYKLQCKWDRNAKPPSGYDPKLYARLKSISTPLRKISAAENNILRNPKLDWDTKNKKLRELEKKREQENVTIVGGSDYVLPIASESVKGGIKIGHNLLMTDETLNVALDTTSSTIKGFMWINDIASSVETSSGETGGFDTFD